MLEKKGEDAPGRAVGIPVAARESSDLGEQRKYYLATMQEALRNLEADAGNAGAQRVFIEGLKGVLTRVPRSIYMGGTDFDEKDFSSVFTRLKRNRIVTENEQGLGDLFVRRALVEWGRTGDGKILEDLDVILSDRKGHQVHAMGSWRKRFGQSGMVAFADETRHRFLAARAQQDVLDCEKDYDGRKAERTRKALEDEAVASRAGKGWKARLTVARRARRFDLALERGSRGEQRETFLKMLRSLASVKKHARDVFKSAEYRQSLCRRFARAAAQSPSTSVWTNSVHHLRAFDYDLAAALPEIVKPADRLRLVNRVYWFDRGKGTAQTPHFYVQAYAGFFEGYRFRFVSPPVGFTAENEEHCLFTAPPK